jgi:hypothetical protein
VLGRGLMAGLQTGPISFVGFSNASAGTVTHPADTRTGDLIVVIANNVSGRTITTSSGSAWSSFDLTENGTSVSIWWKFLNATDVANTWTWSVSTEHAVCQYRAPGSTTLTVKTDSTTKGTGTQASFAGFTASPNSRGVLAVVSQANGVSFVSYPTNFAGRFNTNTSIQNGATIATSLADQVSGYAGGVVAFTHSVAPNWGMIVAEIT